MSANNAAAPLEARRTERKPRRESSVHPSLMDVVFTLVYMFLLTSLLAVSAVQQEVERKLPPVTLPQFRDSESADGGTNLNLMTVTVRPGPEYYAGEQKIELHELGEHLVAHQANDVEIRGDEGVSYGAVMAAMRVCRESGIRQVALTYQMKEDAYGKRN